MAFPLVGGAGGLDEEVEEPEGGLAGNEADAGGVDDLDLAPLAGFVELVFALDVLDLGWGWKGRAMDESLGAVLDVDLDMAVEVIEVDDAPPTVVADAFSSMSIFPLSSSMGIVALGSMGNLSSRQFLSRSVIWLNIWTLPSAVSWYSFKAALCSSKLCCSVAIRLIVSHSRGTDLRRIRR